MPTGIVSTKLVFQLAHVVVIVKFLTVQIKETALQFSTPLYLPPGQKKRGLSGHLNYRWRVNVKWDDFY
jgi:hypothetical protein